MVKFVEVPGLRLGLLPFEFLCHLKFSLDLVTAIRSNYKKNTWTLLKESLYWKGIIRNDQLLGLKFCGEFVSSRACTWS